MKSSNLFAVLSIIALLVISEGATIVHAQTLSKDFGEQSFFNLNGDKGFSYYVKISVQTEQNGVWKVGNTYDVVWTISLTYVNTSIYTNNDFYLLFFEPSLANNQIVLQNDTTVRQGEDGTVSVEWTPTQPVSDYEISTFIGMKAYYNGQIMTGGLWIQNEPIWINIVNNQPESTNPSPMEPIYAYAIVIAVVIIAIGIGAYAYTKRKK